MHVHHDAPAAFYSDECSRNQSITKSTIYLHASPSAVDAAVYQLPRARRPASPRSGLGVPPLPRHLLLPYPPAPVNTRRPPALGDPDCLGGRRSRCLPLMRRQEAGRCGRLARQCGGDDVARSQKRCRFAAAGPGPATSHGASDAELGYMCWILLTAKRQRAFFKWDKK